MAKLILFVFASIFTIQASAQSEYVKEITEYRDSVNHVFADTSKSILLKEDIATFTGLKYYPIKEDYVIPAKFRKLLFKKRFLMQTSTDRLPEYRRYGVLKFRINEEKVKLYLYENMTYKLTHPTYDGLFCPFTDSTKHTFSYGGGRYIDFERSKMLKHVEIDFNKSYNPYCAYNYRYSCPIPPKENQLKVGIPSGIQRWR